ncbi:carbonic anhydrase [Amycolatopsis xylanica]|uniref:carbonic anhydrase n=1 Tax=Amycolatopsis xylanica TaxID=589385 RepID=A0A1H3SSE1_9PSEU|nr:carbonic anhydrase family protein [Amycolatopsis xylanica]SDZ40465.1 carbonic anhydrase [Amycolatopsis xylanica]
MARKAVTATLVPLTLAALVLGTAPAHSQLPHQSPIDITPRAIEVKTNLPPLRVFYGRSDLDLEYIRKDAASPTGCTTRDHEETEEAIVKPGAAYVTLAGTRYDLIQFHFHTPSEHRFNGRSTPLEVHFVHRSAAGKLLVIGVPLRAGAPSTLDTVLANLTPECGEPVHIPELNLNSLLPVNRAALRYDGSLTTAPFSEGVQWFVMQERTVSADTIRRFQALFSEGNARATQPLNDRKVQLGLPGI